MKYSELCEVYEELASTTKKLEKTVIIAKFLKKIKEKKTEYNKEIIYLLQGRVFPDYEKNELGINDKLAVKAISKASGIGEEEVIQSWKKIGDLGEVTEALLNKKKQSTLTGRSGGLTIKKV